MDSIERDQPSKSQKKREMLELQAIGAALVGLNDAQLKSITLPEQLAAAIQEMRRTKGHEGKRRQLQYIGRIMREVDGAAIAVQLERIQQPARQEIARMHRAEKWRDRLLSDPNALAELAALRPDCSFAALQKLIEQARDERAKSMPPKAYRELFRALGDWLDKLG